MTSTIGKRETQEHVVATIAELPAGSTKVVVVSRRSIGIIHTTDGRLYALRNVCPHHGAPLCRGSVTGVMRDSAPQVYDYDEHESVVRCPWHGYAFQLDRGRSLLEPDTSRVRTYPVEIRENGDVVVSA